MNRYYCQIELKREAKALAFASALEAWMAHLKSEDVIQDWRLMRRKLNLAADGFRDFVLEIDVRDMQQLDAAFRVAAKRDDAVGALYQAVHDLIGAAEFGLYRPFPDPERAERMALL